SGPGNVVPEPATVGFVIAEQDAFGLTIGMEKIRAETRMLRSNRLRRGQSQRRSVAAGFPTPGVAEPDLRQQMNVRWLGAAILHRDAHQNLIRGRLRILHEDIEVAVALECSAVDQFVLGLADAAAATLLQQM